jgi:hypothetical protein
MSQFSSSTFGRSAGFWLIVTAAFEVALAGVFVVIGLAVPVADFGMFLTAAILGITGVVLLVIGLRVRSSAAANAALLQTGLAATATVTGVSQTGMYLNENPQLSIDLRVELPGREPYAAKRKEFVPLILLGRLTSGAPLPVRVDRANPQRLVIDWSNVGLALPPPSGAVLAGEASGGGTASAELPAAPSPAVVAPLGATGAGGAAPLTAEQLATMRAWLRQSGAAGTARIDQAMDMGTYVGDDRLFTIQATLEMPGEAPEKLAPVATLVAPTDADKVRVGYRVAVRVAPDNHQLIDFDF